MAGEEQQLREMVEGFCFDNIRIGGHWLEVEDWDWQYAWNEWVAASFVGATCARQATYVVMEDPFTSEISIIVCHLPDDGWWAYTTLLMWMEDDSKRVVASKSWKYDETQADDEPWVLQKEEVGNV